jgi:hypothetical protein
MGEVKNGAAGRFINAPSSDVAIFHEVHAPDSVFAS